MLRTPAGVAGLALTCLALSAPVGAAEVSITSKAPAAVEAFKAGRDLAENLRTAEADTQFKKAIAADPDFAQAHAYLGIATPGAEGDRLIEKAVALSRSLPEPERLLIESFAAQRRGDDEKVRELNRRIADIVPDDWRAHFRVGAQLGASRRWPDAAAAYEKAAALNPKAGVVQNSLGYAHLAQGHNDAAVAAFKKYAQINPGEPNPHDSLGEALMRAGRFAEAEAAFQEALKVSPKFWNAWEGISKARFLRGDAAGSYEALTKARAATARPIDKVGLAFDRAWMQFAEGKKAAAVKTFEDAEKEAVTEKVELLAPFMIANRATMALESGQPEEAIRLSNLAIERATQAKLPGGALNNLRRVALANKVQAEAKLGRGEDAQKTLELVRAEAGQTPANAFAQSTLHFAEGAAAMAKGDVKGAIEHYSRCIDDDTYCRWQLAVAQDKAGAAAAAAATRKSLLEANRRSEIYLYVRAQATPK